MGTPHSFQTVGDVVHVVARRFGLDTKLLELYLRKHWRDIAGEQVAEHTQPDQIRFKKLHLIVDSSVWAHQLTFLKPNLIEKICRFAGRPCISDMVVRVGQVTRLPETPESHQESHDLKDGVSPDSLEQAASHTHLIKNHDLQVQFTMVMAKALSMEQEKRRS